MKSKFVKILIVIISLSLFMISCEKKTSKVTGEKSLNVVTTLFPLYDFAKNIGKKKADVTLLLPPGVESHSFDPKPGDILRIHEADIFVYTGKFMEPWVEDVLKGIGDKGPLIIDSSRSVILTEDTTETEHNRKRLKMDPHIWLDFSKARKMVDNILEGFLKRDPENSNFYQKNATKYKIKLDKLDKRFKDSLSSCKKDVLIHGGHFAFGYLAKRSYMKYLSAYRGFAPDAVHNLKNLIKGLECK